MVLCEVVQLLLEAAVFWGTSALCLSPLLTVYVAQHYKVRNR